MSPFFDLSSSLSPSAPLGPVISHDLASVRALPASKKAQHADSCCSMFLQGRRKIEIKEIKEGRNRSVTFLKRKQGKSISLYLRRHRTF